MLPLVLLIISGSTAQKHAAYNSTIDCSSFSNEIKSLKDSCDMYGSATAWSRIIHRPLPDWYADMKFGVFIHWGPYSVPSYGTEWFWHNYACNGDAPGSVKAFADKNFPSVKQDYPKYADMFHAELYNASAWVEAIKAAGAQYRDVLPVAKHHDGFCMWDARETSPLWDAVEVGDVLACLRPHI